ncbi:bifunctional aconitate hydratase 2/2-methylisocitrate dehydratase [Aliarcobacter butzleri]|uniref:bifunctional aconitate hydratase 2/2-methylisocitrate dehydratase n=1 Tax=Aliarcobacter butzleri TaxID=28197 RepID=UPI00125F2C85|nr:bifunctional aconitate hydratase 2/2-methylisocitrate dehydratase [Aliarcobacter butzleri]MCT7594015.1 bifunctional aconitate hydratase 2/2-methylisocitrate dehydratase [Aliarcobacter butzleri]MCT7598673.1 bifunctional aconitate hydratase 2/2-methylisocitrate dehydratase [Aliarcobacter butzleri]MCT7624939.1 bifunctional aconitate hydratase 2/2-methylisocitrate dehydratase [Aliarcobacter butzleri]MCT7636617.1 bifunctional aconitate hydratase 2/2-methylisocitrate dehydratase [Aliarcobacter but
MSLLENYKAHSQERLNEGGLPALPLTAAQTAELVELLKADKVVDAEYALDLFKNKINPGVDDAAYVKAAFLNDIVQGKVSCSVISKVEAIQILGTMMGGYNVPPLVEALKIADVADAAAEQLKNTILVYNSFNDVKELMDKGNAKAKEVIESWANAEWFTNKPALEEAITLTVYKIPGETNTDDLSPATVAFTRADIPLHATAMLQSRMEKPLEKMAELKAKGHPLAYVGDVVGTGSSRKSGINSVQWHMGRDIPGVPNKRTGGVVIGSIIAPIFFNTAEDSGCLPIQANVDAIDTGDIITLKPYAGVIEKDGKVVSEFKLAPNTLTDEMRAGGRIPLIIGKGLTAKARAALGLGASTAFIAPEQPANNGKGYTQAQKMVGKACGVEGVKPGMYVEPIATTVGSQDTTGPMTRDEIKELAALSFGADMVMQSFCHTAAYPKPADIKLRHTLPDFINSRGGVTLKPGDGVIHSWLNRLCLPDTVGTGGDSHTRFPIGISFPAGSGLIAFAGVTGMMPLTMPESVLVKFSGKMQPGITLRDLVNAIPYYAIKQGLLTVPKKNKKNIFAGTIIEIQGLPDLKVEQAFELSDASAERSAAACSVQLNKEPIIEYLSSNIALIEKMIEEGYEDAKTLQRRADKMKEWIKNPQLLEPDADAEYLATIEINLDEIKEPILACPNDPDDVATLSEILADDNRPKKIEEVFVGSCMTNIGLFRALGEVLKGEGVAKAKLWVAPPTKMDEAQLTEEGYYATFAAAGARIEIPGCSLCMGNQAQVGQGSIVFSTSTRNFDNRLGKDSKVYLGSAEVAAVAALLGRLPSVTEYMEIVSKKINESNKDGVYKYLNFHQVSSDYLTTLVSSR